MRPKVSLIVCTRDRAARLPDFLSRIALLESPSADWELILVDHASTDGTPGLLEEFTSGAPFRVRHLRSMARGLSGAKNEGLARAGGEILAFTDDDCYPRPDFLRAVVEVFAEHRVGVVGGRVVLHDPTDAKFCLKDVDTPAAIQPASFVPAGTIHGANMAVTREVVAAIGGFDPMLGPGTACPAAEDVDYIARAVWAGWTARYDPRPVVAHHHRRKPGKETEQCRRVYDYGRGAYYAKFLLESRTRSVYLRNWYGVTRTTPRKIARGRLIREIAGARRYLWRRLVQSEPTPMFSTAD
jgi:glycosyltransferase involved in cell wall biosynthesis